MHVSYGRRIARPLHTRRHAARKRTAAFYVCTRRVNWIAGRHGSKGEKGDRGTSPDHSQAAVVAFSATLDQNLPLSGEYRVVRFNVVLSNHGAGYSPSTGVFTAPVNGTYLVGFSGVGYDGQDILLHLVRNGQRQLSAFDNSGCSCCRSSSEHVEGVSSASATGGKCAGSASNSGIIPLDRGDRLWVELPDGYGMHNAPYHNYASFYGYLLYTAAHVNNAADGSESAVHSEAPSSSSMTAGAGRL